MSTTTQIVLSFITSLPPDQNVYGALIPFLQAQACNRNPPWMSIVLIIMLIPTIYIGLMAILIIRCHLKRGDYYTIKIQRHGLISVDRFLVEALGGLTYTIVSVLDMGSQLYSDYRKAPVPGKILTLWLRFPIAFFALWCVMFNCIGTHIRNRYDPTHRGDVEYGNPSMPRWVVFLLNTIFVFFSGVFLIAYPVIAVPAHLLETELLNNLHLVIRRLHSAALRPDAQPFSLLKLAVIVQPLKNTQKIVDKLAQAVLSSSYFFEVIDVTVTVTYIIFVYLTYRQFEAIKRSQQATANSQKLNKNLKIDYRGEMKALLIEACVLLIMLCSFQPMFAWAVNTRSANELVRSTATVMVPELTLGIMACFVGPCVATYRYTSAKHLLEIKMSQKPVAGDHVEMKLKKTEALAGHTQPHITSHVHEPARRITDDVNFRSQLGDDISFRTMESDKALDPIVEDDV